MSPDTYVLQVGEQASAQGVLFHSDWSTDTGTSDDALLDTSKDVPWDEYDQPGLEVVSATGLGFPTTNVLRVFGGGGTSNASRVRIDPTAATPIIPSFDVGSHQYWRWYWRFQLPLDDDGSYDPSDDAWHPNETYGGPGETGGSQANYSYNVGSYDPIAETWRVEMHTNGAAYPNDRWRPGGGVDLAADDTYRFEMHLERVSTNFFHMELRLYNGSGTLIYSESQWMNQNSSSSSADGVNIGPDNPWDHFQGMHMGTNGWGTDGPPSTEMTFCYLGAVALRDDDWCGPYSGGI